MQKKSVAIFEIFIVIFSIFIIMDSSYASDVCCERTIDGSSCIFTDENNCNDDYNMAAANCNGVDYCRVGCCINDEGCFKGVPRSSCDGEFKVDRECGYEECGLGCCVLGNECSYVTENRCRNLVSRFSDEEIDYRNIGNELECLNLCRNQEEGCCVNNGVYIYSKAEDCDGEFHYNEYCSSISEECESRSYKGCYGDDVYWFDSCGNREDIFEDCDYTFSTKCNTGTLSCENLNCESTYSDERNVHDSRIGNFRRNGEGWCLYESPVGDFLDRPGSRHYRAMCVGGEEIIEECRDFREEICVSNGEEFSEATCVPHEDDNGESVPSLVSTVPVGFEFWDEGEDICGEASKSCIVVFVKKNRVSSWECKQNCFCLEQSYTDQMAKYCKSLGDCGDDYNVMEVMGEGFSINNNYPNVNIGSWLVYGVFGGMKDNAGDILKEIQDKQVEKPESILPMVSTGFSAISGLALNYLGTWIVKSFILSKMTGVTALSAVPIANAQGAVAGSFLYESGLISVTETVGGGTAVGVGMTGVIIVGAFALASIVISILFTGGDVKYRYVNTICTPWQAPDGGDDCEKCDEFLSCSAYKCRSLGKNCRYIPENLGSERVSCYDANPNDVNSPIISPWHENITQGYRAEVVGYGFNVLPGVNAYRRISIGIKTDELSQCKISREHSKDYDEISDYFGNSYFGKEHSIMLSLEPGTENNFYVKCKDASGNINTRDYYIKILAKAGPDLTPPIIENFNFENNAMVASNVNTTGIIVYVNEPSDCRMGYEDKGYNAMNHSSLICSDVSIVNITFSYNCIGNVDLELGQNTYYFRCKDRNNNINQESTTLTLIKTEPLEVLNKEPDGELYYNDITLSLETNREAICRFDMGNGLIDFFNTNSNTHSQQLTLGLGNYNINIICMDDVGNGIGDVINFTISRDLEASRLIHVYRDGNNLRIVLNEASYCEYNGESFSLGNGVEMTGNIIHSLAMTNVTRYFIICKDQFDNIMDEIIVYP